MNGKLDVAKDGQLHLKEEEGGFDFNVVTVKVGCGASRGPDAAIHGIQGSITNKE